MEANPGRRAAGRRLKIWMDLRRRKGSGEKEGGDRERRKEGMGWHRTEGEEQEGISRKRNKTWQEINQKKGIGEEEDGTMPIAGKSPVAPGAVQKSP